MIERVACTACTAPAAYGRHLTRWDCRRLAEVVVEQAVVESIHYTTVARLLRAASLQPHRSRYWKTARVDEHFIRLAAPVLWCYERVEWRRVASSGVEWRRVASSGWERRGALVLCVDETPNRQDRQALERRCPTPPMRPARIARHEFEYVRHGTVTFLVPLPVYDGAMGGTCLDANDAAHFIPAIERVLARRC